MLLDTDKLVTLKRGNFSEIVIRGEISIVEGNKEIYFTREERGVYPARSCLKPFQFYAADIPMEVWAGEERYSACFGSLQATEFQCGKLREWASGRKKLVPMLKVPRAFPADDAHRAELKKASESPTQLFHTCFSKHMGILEACDRHGWPLENYLDRSHPYHLQLQSVLSNMIGRKLGDADWVTDGCLLPSPSLTTTELAILYQKLAAGVDAKLFQIRDLMMANPNWVAGPSSLDTELMAANPGKVLAKKGADGLLALGIPASKTHKEAAGVVVKIDLGLQMDKLMIALEPVLSHYGLNPVHRAPSGQTVHFHYALRKKSKLDTIDISPLLRPKLGLFPEEVAFCRNVSHDTEKGDVITLSSIQTTLHAGAHTDAPNHFAKSAKGIDTVDVGKYVGPCQVISVKLGKDRRILPSHIQGIALRAPRVLFRTNSYPDETRFNPTFGALSKELVDSLGEKGVFLVGIDTPSIDPAESKTLDAHLATLRWEMAILENVRLEKVEDGIFTLIATPLRIEGGDASPVRALLFSDR